MSSGVFQGTGLSCIVDKATKASTRLLSWYPVKKQVESPPAQFSLDPDKCRGPKHAALRPTRLAPQTHGSSDDRRKTATLAVRPFQTTSSTRSTSNAPHESQTGDYPITQSLELQTGVNLSKSDVARKDPKSAAAVAITVWALETLNLAYSSIPPGLHSPPCALPRLQRPPSEASSTAGTPDFSICVKSRSRIAMYIFHVSLPRIR
jgi:hypothetical protein